MLARLSAGIFGGVAGGIAVGVLEALFVLSTASTASEYQALFAAVVVYGCVGCALGLFVGFLMAPLGVVWTLGSAGAYTLSLWAVSGVLAAQAVFLALGERFGSAVPAHWWALLLGLLSVQTLMACWLGPILLTRTPLKILLRPHGTLAAVVAVLGVSAVFSFTPGRHVALGGFDAVDQGGRLADRPDLLLVLVHGLRADRGLRSFDRLAGHGVTYQRAKTHSAWSGTAVTSLWTSLLPSSHRVLEPGDALDEDADTLFEVLAEQGYATAAVVSGPQVSRSLGFDQGVRWFRSVGLGGLGESTALLSIVRRALADRRVSVAAPLEEARRFVEAQGDDRWFVTVHVGRTEAEGYDEHLAAVDEALDSFLAELEASDRWDDMAVVLTSDHGMELGEHGGMGAGATLYEELLHVPLVVKWPASTRGEVTSQVRLVDIAPTLAELGGAVSAKDWQGERLPVVTEARDRTAFAELARHGVSLSSVQRGDWKLIKGPHRTELYELGLDAHETRNRAGEAGAVQAELERELVALIKASSRQAVGASASDVDRITRERLRALGYLQ